MGTRHLTCVIKDGDFRVAQYGQWDGYPDGQGANILAFLAEADMGRFNDRIRQCVWMSDAEFEKNYNEMGFPADGFLNMEQAEAYKRAFPMFSRDLGSEILRAIYDVEGDDDIQLRDSRSFATESLFCEWAYVIDLDREVLEVYKGFNSDPNANSGVFAGIPRQTDDERYHTVTLVKSYPLNDLPSVETLKEECDPDEDEE